MIFTNLSDDPTLGECLAADSAKRLAALNRAAATVPVEPSVEGCDAQQHTDSDRLADAHRVALVRRIGAGESARVELQKLGVTRAAQSEADALGVILSGTGAPSSTASRTLRTVEPRLQKIVLLETFVAGLQYHAGMQKEVFEQLVPGMRLSLMRERENPHDKNAIAVNTPVGQRLGYIPRKQNKLLAATMDQCFSVAAVIDLIDPAEESFSRVAISVHLYAPVSPESEQRKDE